MVKRQPPGIAWRLFVEFDGHGRHCSRINDRWESVTRPQGSMAITTMWKEVKPASHHFVSTSVMPFL